MKRFFRQLLKLFTAGDKAAPNRPRPSAPQSRAQSNADRWALKPPRGVRDAQLWRGAADLEAVIAEIQRKRREESIDESPKQPASASAGQSTRRTPEQVLNEREHEIALLVREGRERLALIEGKVKERGFVINQKIVESHVGALQLLSALERRLAEFQQYRQRTEPLNPVEALKMLLADFSVTTDSVNTLLTAKPLVLKAAEWQPAIQSHLNTAEHELHLVEDAERQVRRSMRDPTGRK